MPIWRFHGKIFFLLFGFVGGCVCLIFYVHDSYREGRFFCQITLTILEDCSIKYKALHNLEKLMRGDFLDNSDYIVFKHGDSLTFLQLTPNYDLCQVPVNMKIIDICLHNNNNNNYFMRTLSRTSIWKLKL